jgi:hypothetical protein
MLQPTRRVQSRAGGKVVAARDGEYLSSSILRGGLRTRLSGGLMQGMAHFVAFGLEFL